MSMSSQGQGHIEGHGNGPGHSDNCSLKLWQGPKSKGLTISHYPRGQGHCQGQGQSQGQGQGQGGGLGKSHCHGP